MAHFAKVVDGIVTQVIVAELEFIQNRFVDTSPGEWIQTSYNTISGVHTNGGTPLRKNFAGPGFIYDRQRDAFYPPSPYPSWTLNETTCQWEPPMARPESGFYNWNEETQTWDEIDGT
jgi:hypothetical protein